MANNLETILDKAAKAKHITADSTVEKFRQVTGIIDVTEEALNNMENAEWYVPGGAYLDAAGVSGATGATEPTGAQPTGAQPTGAEPTGAEPTGAEPTGAGSDINVNNSTEEP